MENNNVFIIDNLLQQNRSNRLEFQALSDPDTIAKTITAFINTQGGDLIIGVNDDKKSLVLNMQKERLLVFIVFWLSKLSPQHQ